MKRINWMDWLFLGTILFFILGVVHISFIYSIMFTSTAIGLILGILYKPRTWCAVCPIQTLTS